MKHIKCLNIGLPVGCIFGYLHFDMVPMYGGLFLGWNIEQTFMQHFWDLNLQLLVCHVGQMLCHITNILLKKEDTLRCQEASVWNCSLL